MNDERQRNVEAASVSLNLPTVPRLTYPSPTDKRSTGRMTYAVRRSSRLIETISRGYRIHYVDAGSGPPLVLIPGLPMSVARWRAIGYIDDFARDFRVLPLTHSGMGSATSRTTPTTTCSKIAPWMSWQYWTMPG